MIVACDPNVDQYLSTTRPQKDGTHDYAGLLRIPQLPVGVVLVTARNP